MSHPPSLVVSIANDQSHDRLDCFHGIAAAAHHLVKQARYLYQSVSSIVVMPCVYY